MATFGLTETQLNSVLEAAGRAPSLHNTQPWAFRLTADRIELHIDAARLLPAADPDRREVRIGCGAALFNLRLALAGCSVKAAVTVLPAGLGGPVAVLENGRRFVPGPGLTDLVRAIPLRRTNRRPYLSVDVSSGDQQTLARAGTAEGGLVHYITDPAGLTRLREQAAAAHRILLADPAWVAEWNAWTRRVDTFDGVPVSAAGPVPAPQDFWTLRDFGESGRPPRAEGKDFEEQPLIAVLATHADTPVNQVFAGQAMQRMLLTATTLGLSASYLSQLIEVPSAAAELRELIGGFSYPQVVLRVGFGSPTPPTPRRPVAECLLGSPDMELSA